jgi:tyrosyl-tRNA synthetase
MTSPYRFYQYWFNVDDRDVVTYLKWFTLLERSEIDALATAVEGEPAKREAQKRLAREITLAVHGQDGLNEAERVTAAFFGGALGRLRAADIEDVLAGAPSSEVSKRLLEGGMPFDRFAVVAGLCASNAEARRLIEQGGAYINDARVDDPKASVTVHNLIDGRMIILRRGARTYRLVRVAD